VWAVARKLSKQIIKGDVRSKLRTQSCEAVAAAPNAMPARHTHDDIGVESQPIARHGSM